MARYDGRELTGLIDPANTSSSIWPDTSYRSQKNERANAARCKVRSAVEHVFTTQKHMGLFIRAIGIERSKAKRGITNIAFNFKGFLFRESRTATA